MAPDPAQRPATLLAHAVWCAALATGLLESVASSASDLEGRLNGRAISTASLIQFWLCLVAATLFGLIRASAARYPRTALVVAVSVTTYFAWPVGRALTAGPWIREQSYVSALLVGIPLSAGLGMGVVLWALELSHFFRRHRPRIALGVGLSLIATSSAVANGVVFPGQYPVAHFALIALFTCAAVLAAEMLLTGASASTETRRHLRLAFWGGAGVLLTAGVTAAFLLLPPNRKTTVALILGAPRTAYLLEALFPPAPSTEIRDELMALDLSAQLPETVPTTPRTPPWRIPQDWNVVLIVVDALRADTMPPARDVHPKRRFKESDAPFLSRLANESFRFERAYAAATYTYQSMPSLFRSLNAFEPSDKGTSLAALMAKHGRTPIAVTNDYFTSPLFPSLKPMLRDFVNVEVYRPREQDTQRGLTERALADARETPFFAWFHFYATHAPGWNGQNVDGRASEWPNDYKSTVSWVDREIAHLFAELTRLGIRDRTLVVLTSDHGEGLTDTGSLNHGTSVKEEEARVPLLIHFPNQPGALIPKTVGNIDLVPTLSELLGDSPSPTQRGRSLVPLLAGSATDWDGAYFVESSETGYLALVREDQKHVYARKTGLHMHFDLERDPSEQNDVYDPARPEHAALLRTFVQTYPDDFARGLDDPETARLLDQRLKEVTERTSPATLRFLAKLLRLRPTADRLQMARHLFGSTKELPRKWLLIDELFSVDQQGLGSLITHELTQAFGTATEQQWVTALADLGVAEFDSTALPQLFLTATSRDAAQWFAWLRLIARWTLVDDRYGHGLVNVFDQLQRAEAPSPSTLRLALAAVAHLENPSPTTRSSLMPRVLPWLTHPQTTVESDACIALGRIGDASSEALLRQRLDGRPRLVRMGAMEGLASLIGKRAVPEILRLGTTPELTLHAVHLVGELRATEALGFITWAETRPGHVGRQASRARALILGEIPSGGLATETE